MNWQQLNQLGLIPGPDETEEAFKERAAFCLNLEQELATKAEAEFPFAKQESSSKKVLPDSFPLTNHLYGMAPEWVPVFFNNHQLAPWHGGCAWIFQLDDQTPTSAFLQLHAHFRHKKTYLFLYQREELIAHELAHVGRMMYEEPQFEELLAYRSSQSPWRRYFGPLVQSAKETLLFILMMGCVILADLALLVMDYPDAYIFSWWLKLLPLGLILVALMRLVRKQRIFSQALKNLSSLYKDEELANQVIYRLRDQEIDLFARSPLSVIQNYMKEQSLHSFRWRFLIFLYPFDLYKPG